MVEVKTVTLPSGETKTVETGLSPGQTAGYVEGTYTVRPPGTEITQPYSPGVGSTSIMIEGGAAAGRGGTGVGETTTVRRDVYGNVIGIKQVSPTKETIFERRLTPGGGYVEEGLPYSVQPIYAEIERTRAEMPLYRQMAIPAQVVAVPTPFQTGFVGQGGIYQALEERRLQQQYPSTPIDYSRMHVSELYSYPLYKGAAFVSSGLQYGSERVIELFPEPQAQKEVQKGVSSLVTGIPEFFASGLAGLEYAAREPEVFKTGSVPAVKMFGAGLVEQATERPYFTLGQAAGIGYGMRGLIPKGKLPEVFKGKTAYAPETGMRGARPSEIRTVDLSLESRKPIFPEVEGTPLPRTIFPYGAAYSERISIPKTFETSRTVITEAKAPEIVKPLFPELEGTPLSRAIYPYGVAYAEKITYPKGYKFKTLGKGLTYERWGEKPISPTEYFGSITRGRFMAESDVFGTNKIFGGRSFRKGEIDPWAGKPTMRQSAEARGETLKRTITQPKIKPIEPIGGTELKYGKQSLIAVMEEPKPITKTVQVQKTRAIIKPIALTQYRQKEVALTMPRTQQRAITLQTQRMTFKPFSVSRQISPQVSGFAMAYPTTSIQTPKTTQRQIYGTEQAFKPIQRSVSISIPIIMKIQKPKTTSDILGLGMKGRKGRRGGFKFPELTRVATPKEIMKGFRL